MKTYIKPEIEAITMDCERMIATSPLEPNDEIGSGVQQSNKFRVKPASIWAEE